VRILVALDFTECSSLPCRWVLAHAAGLGASGVIFHHVAEPGEPSTELDEIEEATRELRKFVEALAVDMPLPDDIEVRYAVARGKPSDEILRTVAVHRVDTIVMGTNSRKGLDRLLLGSVAESIVRAAPCTVVVVKPGAGA
jgi:nucleotide-binding universal stress UspA family protein